MLTEKGKAAGSVQSSSRWLGAARLHFNERDLQEGLRCVGDGDAGDNQCRRFCDASGWTSDMYELATSSWLCVDTKSCWLTHFVRPSELHTQISQRPCPSESGHPRHIDINDDDTCMFAYFPFIFQSNGWKDPVPAIPSTSLAFNDNSELSYLVRCTCIFVVPSWIISFT